MEKLDIIPPEPSNYLVQLTSVRGIACLFVLIGHAVQVFHYNKENMPAVWRVFSSLFNAEAAVLVFFVLSGCVLSLALRKMDKPSLRFIGAFYVQRAFRIYPLLWFSVGLSLLCLWSVRQTISSAATVDWLARNLSTPIDIHHVFLALMGIFTRYNGPMWSLRVELLFSVIYPFMLIILRNQKYRFVLLGVCFLISLIPLPDGLGPQFALAFCLGTLITILPAPKKHYSWMTIGCFVMLMCDRFVFSNFHFRENVFDILETLFSFFLIRNIYFFGKDMKFLNSSFLVNLGELSYSIYLLHLQLLLVLFSVFMKVWGERGLLDNPVSTQILLVSSTFLATLILSCFTYRVIELPLHSLGRSIARTMRSSG
ncbi:acyltransferase family protein [Acetobacter sp. UBA5411]|uniref:acyltransferase family protein n=1 Tax=Acetobacter sp. UBA5411 TaxID=1945905 RepID=UPI0025BE02DD|nr:acyltransferase [Acetobacter sp. UBA5411]